jgi:hypothetical protein
MPHIFFSVAGQSYYFLLCKTIPEFRLRFDKHNNRQSPKNPTFYKYIYTILLTEETWGRFCTVESSFMHHKSPKAEGAGEKFKGGFLEEVGGFTGGKGGTENPL